MSGGFCLIYPQWDSRFGLDVSPIQWFIADFDFKVFKISTSAPSPSIFSPSPCRRKKNSPLDIDQWPIAVRIDSSLDWIEFRNSDKSTEDVSPPSSLLWINSRTLVVFFSCLYVIWQKQIFAFELKTTERERERRGRHMQICAKMKQKMFPRQQLSVHFMAMANMCVRTLDFDVTTNAPTNFSIDHMYDVRRTPYTSVPCQCGHWPLPIMRIYICTYSFIYLHWFRVCNEFGMRLRR